MDLLFGGANNDVYEADDGEADTIDDNSGIDSGTFDCGLDVVMGVEDLGAC